MAEKPKHIPHINRFFDAKHRNEFPCQTEPVDAVMTEKYGSVHLDRCELCGHWFARTADNVQSGYCEDLRDKELSNKLYAIKEQYDKERTMGHQGEQRSTVH